MASVHVSQQLWSGISTDDQGKIETIFRNTGLIGAEDKMVPHTEPSAALQLHTAGNPACSIACNAAEALAISACATLGPLLGPVCVAAAHTAADYCRSRC